MQNVKEKINNIIKEVDKYIDIYTKEKYPEKIFQSMRYSLLAGGKRLRPTMAIEVATLFGANMEEIIPTAVAIEMLHCQSLIHDDLPSMDNDDFRRGKPSNHKAFDEATAILAGDALLSYAPKLIIDKTPTSISAETKIEVLKEFFIAAGVDGIIAGQIVDLDSENKEITKETLEYLYEYKTAKLFKLSVRAGALIGKATKEQIEALTLFAQYYGYAFQIFDDILDETSTLEKLGKTPKKDEKAGKSTYISMFGMDKAKEQVVFLCNKAYDILNKNNINSSVLNKYLTDIVEGIKEC